MVFKVNKKIINSPFINQLTKTGYSIYLRGIKNSIDLFREENIPLNTKLQELEQQFGEINGAQSIEYKGEKMTLIKKKTEKVKYYSDLTKGEMVKIISEQKGLNLSALDRATKIDIEEIAKALNVNANYKGAK